MPDEYLSIEQAAAFLRENGKPATVQGLRWLLLDDRGPKAFKQPTKDGRACRTGKLCFRKEDLLAWAQAAPVPKRAPIPRPALEIIINCQV